MTELLFLGTGSSMGVPMIGCSCPVCTSNDPRNRRLRTSALVTFEGKRLLIDTGPDFREQALTHKINDLDGVILSHAHYDHVGGLDELRVYYFMHGKSLPCLLSDACEREVRCRHAHLFEEPDLEKNVTAKLNFEILEKKRGKVNFAGVELGIMSYKQGATEVMGMRFGDLAYLSDIRTYPETIFEDLAGVRTLVVSALRYEASHVHFTVPESIAFAEKVGAEQTYFIHMGHELDHAKTSAELPDGISLAYDGLRITA